jgi:multisubunit Na+/H+ antiporter MnhC subunit
MISGALLGFMASFAGPLLLLWIGSADKFKSAVPLLAIFCVPYQTHILTGPASAYHRGVGHPGRELVYPVIQLVLVAIFVSVGFAVVGRTTIVIGIAVASAMVLSGLIYIAYTNRKIKVPQWSFWSQAFLPGVIPYLFAYLMCRLAARLFIWAGVSRLRLGAVIGTSGLIYLAVVSAVLYLCFCSRGEREYLRRQSLHTISGFLGRSAA